jgi:phosphonate transport system substrate-binding protein
MNRVMMALALAMSLGTSGAFAQGGATFVFTAIPDQDETRLVERFTRVADYLQAKLGVPVKYLPVKSYPAAVTAFTNGQVQLAWFGGFTGVQARRQVPDSEAIAQGAEDVAFKSFFIANTKTGLTPSKEFPKAIAGKSFTFGSRASTSGRLMPEYFVRRAFGPCAATSTGCTARASGSGSPPRCWPSKIGPFSSSSRAPNSFPPRIATTARSKRSARRPIS